MSFSKAVVALVVLIHSTSADANWSLRKIVNNSNQIASVSVPISPGATVPGNFVQTRGDIAVIVPGQGPIVFRDQGHNSPCSRPYWGVSVTFKKETWGFFYDGGGTVDLTINSDGTITLSPGPAGQVVVGNGPPQCSQ
ncbi:MAG TPA: hypothetical protein VNM92_05595 [Thermoanaerobaculia bacterium]|nr:hypothetical protein [Thermoanaerobaculia bacterium]